MKAYRELYLANNLEDLHLLAVKQDDYKNIKKFDTLVRSTELLYKNIQNNPLDEEKMYIYLVRYLNLFNHMLEVLNDNKFVELRFGSDARKVNVQLEEVKKSLKERYETAMNEKNLKLPPPKITEIINIPQTKLPVSVFQNSDFVTCKQLYSALKDINNNILIMDARPETDYKQSHIKNVNCINIPDHLINSGLSAHRLGLTLPAEAKEQWDKRDLFSVIVLMDWDTVPESLSSSQVAKLRSILVDWDLKCNYNENPVVLSGGFLEWLQYYPTTCTDPHVVYNRQNSDLDELLDLDNIQYPSDMDPNIYTMGNIVKPETVIQPPEITPPSLNDREKILKEEKDIVLQKQKVEKELLDAEREWIKVHNVLKDENDISVQEELQSKEQNIQNEIEKLEKVQADLNEKKMELEQHYALYASFEPGNEDSNQDENIKEICDIDDETVQSAKILDEMANHRKLLLDHARATKVNYQNEKNLIEKCDKPPVNIPEKIYKPTVNRRNKPYIRTQTQHSESNFKVSNGLSGLKNIRNTCYMNTVIQCIRHIPIIMDYFCSGKYAKQVCRVPDVLLVETAYLVRLLWSNLHSSIRPEEFYKKVCAASHTYKLGHHEDCMEFFMFLFTQLSEDCAYDLPANRMMTPLQKAWYDQHSGKHSFFIDTFYHQLRILQICKKCMEKTTKFETENTFMLSLSRSDNINLDDLMEAYLSDDIIQDYYCSNCKSEVVCHKDICYHPKVLVIVLKRYAQDFKHGTVKKNEAPVNFRLNNFKVGNELYKLNAIACHVGTMTSGHYTAVCLNPINNQWYEFNDETVRTINVTDRYVKTRACAYFYTMQ